MASFVLEANLNVQDPIIDIIVSFFQPDIRGNINKTVDIKRYRLWRVSKCKPTTKCLLFSAANSSPCFPYFSFVA